MSRAWTLSDNLRTPGQVSRVGGDSSQAELYEMRMFDVVERRFRDLLPSDQDCDFVSLRMVEERHESVTLRKDVLQPVSEAVDVGALWTVFDKGGQGYAATSDLSLSGLRAALQQARDWAARTRGFSALGPASFELAHPQGDYSSVVEEPWQDTPLSDKIALLQAANRGLSGTSPIVDWTAALWCLQKKSMYLTHQGGRVCQDIQLIMPDLSVTANQGGDTQTRSLGAYGESRQGGLEMLKWMRFSERPAELKREVLQLLEAPNCPSETLDLLLMPDQMMLQIHESIGHPLELDRILGDERNYAGSSFVTLDMFGRYQYGSELLNVTFDPSRPSELASYAFDDEGTLAEKQFVIERGVLKRPLGGATSQARAGLSGTANARAEGWNRPAIDRMANLNVEPGHQTLKDLITGIERGILMQTNCSWSIDDQRNKFQFGCELGRIIENGELGQMVKNPNYRGVSATFWRNLTGVGDESHFEVMGTPFCGKGEPNQLARVGHASPPCRFCDVEVFGGA